MEDENRYQEEATLAAGWAGRAAGPPVRPLLVGSALGALAVGCVTWGEMGRDGRGTGRRAQGRRRGGGAFGRACGRPAVHPDGHCASALEEGVPEEGPWGLHRYAGPPCGAVCVGGGGWRTNHRNTAEQAPGTRHHHRSRRRAPVSWGPRYHGAPGCSRLLRGPLECGPPAVSECWRLAHHPRHWAVDPWAIHESQGRHKQTPKAVVLLHSPPPSSWVMPVAAAWHPVTARSLCA